MLFEDILTPVFEGRFSEVESLTEKQTESLFRKLHGLCFFGLPPLKKKVAADKHVLKLPLFTLTRLTAVIFTKLRLKVKSIACVTSVSPRVRRESWDESKKKEGKEGNACPQTPRF